MTDRYETEFMHLYSAYDWEGDMEVCDEGDLEWLPMEKVFDLKIWEGDKIFFWLMQHDAPFFSLKLEYIGDELMVYALDGEYHRRREGGPDLFTEFLETCAHRYDRTR